jgi:hypothetical protein
MGRIRRPQDENCLKQCFECWQCKPPSSFYRTGRKCRACVIKKSQKRYEEKKEEIRAYKKLHSKKNRARIAARQRIWNEANKERRNIVRKAWRKRNPAKHIESVVHRRAKQLNATPKWANLFFVQEAYDLAKRRTKATGFKWQVDHIVPLRHPLVQGFHVEHNLRVISESINRAKSNRVWPDMP